MASLNQCNFIGNVGKIETRYMPNGEAVSNISLACNETWKSKDGERQEKCEWVNAVIYRKLAEVAEKYIKVGSQLFITGKMSTRKWEKDGVTRYSTEIVVSEMSMLGGKPSGEQGSGEQSGERKNVAHPGNEVNSAAGKQEPRKGTNFDNFDDDIPF